MAALAGVAGVLAIGGLLGLELASQSLLANLLMHSAVVAGVLSLGIISVGWRIIGGTGLVAAVGLVASGVAGVDWRPVEPLDSTAIRFDVVHFNMLFSNPNGLAIVSWLEAEKPDLAILLEAAPIARHLDQLSRTFPYRLGCIDGECDLVVLSRHPLREGKHGDLPGAPGRLATARVEKDGAVLVVAATHWSKSFFSELRGNQATATRRAIVDARRGGPVLLTGDFNATHWEPEITRFSKWLGLGHPARWIPTWPRRLGPLGAQIDHVLVSRDVVVEHLSTVPARLGSNHRGLRARLAIRSEPRPGSSGLR